MDKVAYVRELLIKDKGNWPDTAARCGVSREWVVKLVSGAIAEPGYQKIERLYCYLQAKHQNTNRAEV